ncbi:uncharacterized protein VP01_211g3 [Puccinia sorghi]|uniref:Uncharacterized protein n=1 Tax=Puccinia sorghi TaxID=27349 RepID=A0A0L6V9W5_9BASI|nr:uncharacterized protein VP01_211g3 [Puccinia sorghi]
MRMLMATALAFSFFQGRYRFRVGLLVKIFSCFFFLRAALLQGPSFAAAHCFEARDVAGNAQASVYYDFMFSLLKGEPYGRRSFLHCCKSHKDDHDYDDDKDSGY